MSEEKPNPAKNEAQTLIEEIKRIKIQSEELLKETETARKGADNSATYAFQAKVNAEEHAKATAAIKGTAEADQNSVATNKQKSDEILAALTRGKVDVDADGKAITRSRTWGSLVVALRMLS